MILIYGGTGFIGKHIVNILKNKTKFSYILSKKRIYNYNDVLEDIEKYKPKYIISAAGYSTPNTIDFYEKNKSDLLLTNTTGNLILAYLCNKMNIHLTLIMSGCIYDYQDKPYFLQKTEDHVPNFFGSYYSANRIQTEKLLEIYDNICIIRLRMPISSDMHPKSLITKIINYKNVIDIPNSMSVLDDVLPFIIKIINYNLVGTFNVVNTGIISHPEILELYKKYINPNYKYNIISKCKQNIIAQRSNCHLSNSKLLQYYNPKDIYTSIENIFKKMSKTLDNYNIN